VWNSPGSCEVRPSHESKGMQTKGIPVHWKHGSGQSIKQALRLERGATKANAIVIGFTLNCDPYRSEIPRKSGVGTFMGRVQHSGYCPTQRAAGIARATEMCIIT